jgi:uncharacterized protein (UPF0332 family)
MRWKWYGGRRLVRGLQTRFLGSFLKLGSLREKSHYALLIALREFFSNQLDPVLIRDFQEAMSLREEADYGLIFSEEGAREVVDNAERFLDKAKEILHA